MKYGLHSLSVLIISLFFISCESSDDKVDPPVFNEDISGEFEGIINVAGIGEGTVLYRFERDSSNVFKGYYEGIEFAEVTVRGNFLFGEPSNGNTSFSYLNGEYSGSSIVFSGFDSDDNSVFSFSGEKIEEGTRQTGDILISGNDYLIKEQLCNPGILDYTTIHSFRIIGGVELSASLSLRFENEPAPGIYNAVSTSTPPVADTFNGDISVKGRSIDIIGGSVEVTATNTGFEIALDNLVFDADSVVNVNIEGSIACGE